MPNPRPRLLPVIKIEFMIYREYFCCCCCCSSFIAEVTLSITQFVPDVFFFFCIPNFFWVKTLKSYFFLSFFFYTSSPNTNCSPNFSIHIWYKLLYAEVIASSRTQINSLKRRTYINTLPHAYTQHPLVIRTNKLTLLTFFMVCIFFSFFQ